MSAKTPEQLLVRVVALTRLLGIDYMSEGWHANRFKKTVAAANERLKKDGRSLSEGVQVSWHQSTPDKVTLRVGEFTLKDSAYPYAVDAKLSDAIGQAFLEDLELMALKRLRQQIDEERERRLDRMATRRLQRMLESAELASPEVVTEQSTT